MMALQQKSAATVRACQRPAVASLRPVAPRAAVFQPASGSRVVRSAAASSMVRRGFACGTSSSAMDPSAKQTDPCIASCSSSQCMR